MPESSMKKVNCTNIKTCSKVTSGIDGNCRFVEILDENGTAKFLRKSKVLWLVTQPAGNISKDRLKRVQGVQNTITKKRKNTEIDHTSKRIKVQGAFEVMNEIQNGQWCIFEKPNDGSDNKHAENELYEKFAVSFSDSSKSLVKTEQTNNTV